MLLLGHRGARTSRHIPENTLESFELCLQHGCDGFEFDVRYSADGVAVVCHDPVIRQLEIASTRAEDLLLPTLGEVLRQFAARAFLDIEIKVSGLERQLVDALRRHPPQNGFVVSSFLPDALHAVHEMDSSVALGFLYERDGQVAPASLPLACVIPHFRLISREVIKVAHASRQKVMTWTVNQVDEMRLLADWGVDAIISDDTELLVRTFR